MKCLIFPEFLIDRLEMDQNTSLMLDNDDHF